MLEPSDKDKDVRRKLLSRTWPTYQPDLEQLNIIRDEILKRFIILILRGDCKNTSSSPKKDTLILW